MPEKRNSKEVSTEGSKGGIKCSLGTTALTFDVNSSMSGEA